MGLVLSPSGDITSRLNDIACTSLGGFLIGMDFLELVFHGSHVSFSSPCAQHRPSTNELPKTGPCSPCADGNVPLSFGRIESLLDQSFSFSAQEIFALKALN